MFLRKKYIKKINKNAFSIIEISVVILIVSVMIVGVTTGRAMFAKSRLANAQSLTQKSVVNDMGDDLIAWYETSLESSFITSEIKSESLLISVWKDSNKSTVNRNDATQATNANKPTLVQNVFYNSIPGLRLSGVQYFDFDGRKFVKNSYTVFVVEQRRSGQGENYFIAGANHAVNGNLHIGYRSNFNITQAHYGNDFNTPNIFPDYSPTSPTPRIHTFLFNNSIGKQYTLNGKSTYKDSSPQTAPLDSFNGARIGYYLAGYQGDLAEIIMFKRSLKTEEVEAIESYLGSKYGIPVS